MDADRFLAEEAEHLHLLDVRTAQPKDELSSLGRHKTGKGCLYIKSLSDVNRTVLKNILAKAFKEMKKQSTDGLANR